MKSSYLIALAVLVLLSFGGCQGATDAYYAIQIVGMFVFFGMIALVALGMLGEWLYDRFSEWKRWRK